MLSSSRAGNEDYLQSARPMIQTHLAGINNILFVPYAGVTVRWDDYTEMVQQALPDFSVTGIHQHQDPVQAINNAEAIAVGGGNTFNLLNTLYQLELMQPIRNAVTDGTPYVGWSAGSNICGNSIRTTNDMPIIQPPSFAGLNLVPFQLNPHYTDYQPPGHNGETRAQRIAEFCTLNPDMPVLGIKEGTALLRDQQSLTLLGDLPGVVFQGTAQQALSPGQDLSHYLTI